MVVAGHELGVLEVSGGLSSDDIAIRRVSRGVKRVSSVGSLAPVVHNEATTNDAVFTEEVLQEVVLDGDGSVVGGRVSGANS